MHKHFIADDGERVSVHVAGEGPAIVMLHGWTSTHRDWSMFLADLTQDFCVYRWDARCRGDYRPLTRTPPTVSRMARDLDNLLEHFGIEQAVVVGHSMGALTLWQYVQDFGTARIAKLCFIDQSPRLLTDEAWKLGIYSDFDAGRSRRFIADLHRDFPDTVLKLVGQSLNARARAELENPSAGWLAYGKHLAKLNPEPLITAWESLTRADYRETLSKINVPTLLIYGGESNFYVADTAAYVGKAIHGAQLHIYPGRDHAPHQWEKNRFLADLRAFIANS